MRLPRILPLPLAMFVTAACTDVEPESEPDLSVDNEALVGRQDGDASCSPYTEALVSYSSHLARTVANSDAFAQCVAQKMASDYVPCGDPFPTASRATQIARAWEAFHAANHVEYSCSYTTASNESASAAYQGWGTRGTHHVDLADDWAEWFGDWSWYAGFQPFPWRASGIVHEFMHTHDYAHPNAGCPAGYHGGHNSVPYIYGTCAFEILQASHDRCGDFDTLDTRSLELVDAWPAGATCERVTDSLHRIALRTDNGRYLSAIDGGGADVDAHGYGQGPWETLFVVDLDSGRLMSGDTVHIKTFGGEFLRATGGALDARMIDPDTSATSRFRIYVAGGGEVVAGKQVTVRASDNHYVVAENGGGGAANANRATVGPWERFTVEQPRREHVVRLRAESTGDFVQRKGNGTMWVDATRSDSADQAFWLLDHDGGELEDGDVISLETLRGSKFVSTCASGTGQVRGTADYVSACSRFTLVKLGGSPGTAIRHGDALALRASNGDYLTGVPSYPPYTDQLRNYSTWIGPWQRFDLDLAQGDRWEVR
ncbi:MAG: hypothetical protein H6708_31600 [Kofleriaceae bacterium]|nr:hypothetical protein [Myxococcales bacterium]MCB9564953.1 hypothetical protein [Kofleriaceae bacterium]